jgi:hypothetical protein
MANSSPAVNPRPSDAVLLPLRMPSVQSLPGNAGLADEESGIVHIAGREFMSE